MALSASERQKRWRERKAVRDASDDPLAKAVKVFSRVPVPKAPVVSNPVVSGLLDRLRYLPDDSRFSAWLRRVADEYEAQVERDVLARELVRVADDANDGFGPRVLTPHEQRLAALRGLVPTVSLGGGDGEAKIEGEGGPDGEASDERW